jgi:hypothetical protein
MNGRRDVNWLANSDVEPAAQSLHCRSSRVVMFVMEFPREGEVVPEVMSSPNTDDVVVGPMIQPHECGVKDPAGP